MKEQLSMKDLAELAGLDTSTVSRALRGDTRRVAKATIERVRRLARETGFIPDPAAASLRGGPSRLLGVVVNNLNDVVMGMLVTAIVAESHQRGYQPMVVATHDDPKTRAEAIRRVLGRRVDGFILCDSLIGHEIPEALADETIPFVFAMRGCEGKVSVTADDFEGGRMVAKHFLDQGHTNIALIPGPSHARTAVERGGGFRGAIEEHPTAALVVPGSGGYDSKDGYEAAKALFAMKQRPTAIFCTNDHAAIGASRALFDMGVQVGRDVAVAGYNDLPWSRYLQTPLTSVRTDIPAMGRGAASRLIDWIEDGTVSSKLITPELIVRASSAYPAPEV